MKYCMAGRPGEPQEIANVVAFVSSDKGSYLNGQNIFVDGGLSIVGQETIAKLILDK